MNFDSDIKRFTIFFNNLYTLSNFNENNTFPFSKNLLNHVNYQPSSRKRIHTIIKFLYSTFNIHNKNSAVLSNYIEIIKLYETQFAKKHYKKKIKVENKKLSIEEFINLIKMNYSQIKLNHHLDTSYTKFQTILPFSTIELESKFGKPLETNHSLEYKFEYNNVIYSIYDWKAKNQSYYQKDWFLATNF